MTRPQIGGLTLLVYRECPCGSWCATGEGARHPVCPDCGGRFVPGGGSSAEGPLFGSSSAEAREIRGLAFVAFLTAEIPAARLLARVQRWLGLWTDWGPTAELHGPGPYYTDAERERAA